MRSRKRSVSLFIPAAAVAIAILIGAALAVLSTRRLIGAYPADCLYYAGYAGHGTLYVKTSPHSEKWEMRKFTPVRDNGAWDISKNGAAIAFAAASPHNYLATLSLVDGTMRTVGVPNCYGMAFNSEADKVAVLYYDVPSFIREDRIGIWDLAGNEFRPLDAPIRRTTGKEPWLAPVGWLSDTEVIVEGPSNTIVSVNIDSTGETKSLFAGACPHLSPDRRFIAYENDGVLLLRVLATGADRKICDVARGHMGMAWSPDSKFLTYVCEAPSQVGVLQQTVMRVSDGAAYAIAPRYEWEMKLLFISPQALRRFGRLEPLPIVRVDRRRQNWR